MIWSDDIEKQTTDAQMALIDKAVEKAEAFKPDPKSIFEHVYSFMPDILKSEEEEAIKNNYWM